MQEQKTTNIYMENSKWEKPQAERREITNTKVLLQGEQERLKAFYNINGRKLRPQLLT